MIKGQIKDAVDVLHSTRRGTPMLHSTSSTRAARHGLKRAIRAQKHPLVFAPIRLTSLLAAFSMASMRHVQTASSRSSISRS